MSTFSGGETIAKISRVYSYGNLTGSTGTSSSPFYAVPAGRYAQAYLLKLYVGDSNFTSINFSTSNTGHKYYTTSSLINGGQDLILMDAGDKIYRTGSGNTTGSPELYIFIKEFTKPIV